MHVTMTQGVVSVDVSLTKEEVRHLMTILCHSDSMWSNPYDTNTRDVESTSWELFRKLQDFSVRPLKMKCRP